MSNTRGERARLAGKRRGRVRLAPVGWLVATLLASHALDSAAEPFQLQILHASDLEGGVNALGDAPNFAAVVAALEADARRRGIPSVLLSAGDNFIPGPFFNAASDPAVRTALRTATGLARARGAAGRVDITIMNLMGFDASALGNHEFDAGTAALADIIGASTRDTDGDGKLDEARWLGSTFPYLSANLDFSADPRLGKLYTGTLRPTSAYVPTPDDLAAATVQPRIAPAAVIERGAVRIGVVGLTTPELERISSPAPTRVTSPATTDMAGLARHLQPHIDALVEAGIDKIILLSHLQQLDLERELASLLEHVDVIVAGGSDTLLADGSDRLREGDVAAGEYPVVVRGRMGKPVLLVSTDGQYSYVGRLVVTFDDTGIIDVDRLDESLNGAYGTDPAGVARLWKTPGDAFAADSSAHRVKNLTHAVRAVVLDKDGKTFGHSVVHLDGRRHKVRTEETNFGRLTAIANLEAARALDPAVAVSIKNGGGIRSSIGSMTAEGGGPPAGNSETGKAPGEVSQLDIENALRFNNGLSLLTVTARGLVTVLEHAVAEVREGATPGRFPQVAGLRFSFDPRRPPGARVVSLAIVDEQGPVRDVLVASGKLQGDPDRTHRIVTLDFLAKGGDGYPFESIGATDRIDLVDPVRGIGASGFAQAGSEQDALAAYLARFHAVVPYGVIETPPELDRTIVNLARRAPPPPLPTSDAPRLDARLIGRLAIGAFDEGAAEVAGFDPYSQRLFVTQASRKSFSIVDLATPSQPMFTGAVALEPLFADRRTRIELSGIAVRNGLVAVAVSRFNKVDGFSRKGLVAFFDAEGRYLAEVAVGHGPGMLVFSPDGRALLTANEGRPNDTYTDDPAGSISIIDVSKASPCASRCIGKSRIALDVSASDVTELDFASYDGQKVLLRQQGIRIFGPQASVARDLEPEAIGVAPDSREAWVSLQENNGLAHVDLLENRLLGVAALQPRPWRPSVLDAGKRTDETSRHPDAIARLPQPGAIAAFENDGAVFVVTANEGAARSYAALGEAARVADLKLDPQRFPDATELQRTGVLGQLSVTTVDTDRDADGDVDRLLAFGGHSFSIFESIPEAGLRLVFDSGDLLERVLAGLGPAELAAGQLDNRAKPAGLALGAFGGRHYVFVGLDVASAIAAFDVTVPGAPRFASLLSSRLPVRGGQPRPGGDLGPNGLVFVAEKYSPSGTPLLVTINEVSGSIAVFELEQHGAASRADNP